jgi:hypothetical protein
MHSFVSTNRDTLTVQNVVGLAHVVLGAYVLTSAGFAFLFANVFSLWVPVLLLFQAALLVVAGLWLRDGRRRGAVLAGVLDGVRLVMQLLLSQSIGLDALISLALLAAVGWLLPTLRSKAA